MEYAIKLTLSYDGSNSKDHQIDLYDISQALTGFHRTLALTTHLLLNNKVITQAPSLKGAQVFALPAEEGSWKITAGIILSGTFMLGTVSKDTVIGNIIFSAYDYVISESLGFHIDFDKSLGQQYEEYNKNKENDNNKSIPEIKQYQLDSLIEKCSNSFKEMHRPIFKTATAKYANLSVEINQVSMKLTPTLDYDTYQYLEEEIIVEKPIIIKGYVSSYNSNTFKGRIYNPKEGRPIPFELSEDIKNNDTVGIIVKSLSDNALNKKNREIIYCKLFKTTTKTGRIKSYKIVKISKIEISNIKEDT